jgi:Putative Actinobacterial Holin-X, holin superfamily III
MVDLKNQALPRALSDVVADLADLFQKELRLAKAELSEKLSIKAWAGVWMAAAAFFALLAVILVVQAAVFAVATFGFAMHWSCLIVATVLAAVGAAAFAKGRADAAEDLTPNRTIHQVKQDIAIAKEQLS